MSPPTSPNGLMVLRYCEESERWQRDHADAMAVRDVEEWIRIGLGLFANIQSAEARAYSATEVIDIERLDCEFADAFTAWLKPSEMLLAATQTWAQQGFHVDGVDEFREAIAQARPYAASLTVDATARHLDNAALLQLADSRRPADWWLTGESE